MRFVGFNAMKRRSALRLVVLAAAAPVATRAQPATRRGPVRIAILDDSPEPTRRALWDAMVRRLAELGYVEGRNAVVEMRFADGNADRLRTLAAASVASNPDVVVTVTTGGGLAMRAVTTTIPVVVLGPAEPVKSGLIASLARPGGNVTGLSPNQAAIAVKWLELVRLLAPRARTFVYLTDPANPGEMLVFRELERRALALDLQAQAMDGVDAGRVERAFAAMQSRPPDALVVATSASLLPQRRQNPVRTRGARRGSHNAGNAEFFRMRGDPPVLAGHEQGDVGNAAHHHRAFGQIDDPRQHGAPRDLGQRLPRKPGGAVTGRNGDGKARLRHGAGFVPASWAAGSIHHVCSTRGAIPESVWGRLSFFQ